MKVSLIQMDMQLNAPDENFEKAKQQIEKAYEEKPDVIVLPETWNVGFSPENIKRELCDNNGERVKKEIAALAKANNVNIVAGSVANIKNGKLYNTAYVFDRNGECVAEYDKTHLFSPMGEDKYFEKGNGAAQFYLDGHLCTLIICYDVRFPEIIRTVTSKSQTDFLFMVSQWPKIRVPHLKALVTARAIENQMFAVCCNSCSIAADTKYGGNSMVVDPWGEIKLEFDDKEQIASCECDTDILSDIRNSINVFADRRSEIYKI